MGGVSSSSRHRGSRRGRPRARLAGVLAASGYGERELEAILWGELCPVLWSNLASVAGSGPASTWRASSSRSCRGRPGRSAAGGRTSAAAGWHVRIGIRSVSDSRPRRRRPEGQAVLQRDLVLCGLMFCSDCKREASYASRHVPHSDGRYRDQALAMESEGWMLLPADCEVVCPACAAKRAVAAARRVVMIVAGRGRPGRHVVPDARSGRISRGDSGYAHRQRDDRPRPGRVADVAEGVRAGPDAGRDAAPPGAGANCARGCSGTSADRSARPRAARRAALPPLPNGFERQFSRDAGCPQAEAFGDVSVMVPAFDAHRAQRSRRCGATPEQLNRPIERPTARFKTVGEFANFEAAHTSIHAGQITIIRRSLGRPSADLRG